MVSSYDIVSLQDNWDYLTVDYDKSFAETYKLIHQAIQFLAITGKSVLPPRFDDSHTSFTWDFGSKCFTSAWLHAKRTFRLEFNPATLALSVIPYGDKADHSVQIAGKTKKEVYSLLRQMLLSEGLTIQNFEYEMHYDIPEHPVCRGGKYKILDPERSNEVAKHYSNAFLVLNLLRGKFPMAGAIRCWPHHFDITADFPVVNQNGNSISNFSVGFSPTNPDFPEPHFYFTIKQESSKNRLNKVKLKFGKWLPGSLYGTSLGLNCLVKKTSIKSQVETLSGFINESYSMLNDQLLHTNVERQKVSQ